ncbi:MAG: tryptophan 7-halogenase [Bacteroidetes bacterium]|nr:tryptophan 7-halogenase [Bacteroidota bacterium]
MKQADVIIIGGGPAGSAMACYIARSGASCIVFEKEKFPRPHVGESLVPASNRVFNDLNFFPKMEAAGFLKKFGAAWTTYNSANIYNHDFAEFKGSDVDILFNERKQKDIHEPHTYHVDRGRFDQLLLEHAAEMGASTFQEADVFHVDFIDKRNVHVSVRMKDGQEEKFGCKILVDASGRHTFMGNKLKIKVKDPVFNQCAVHTWFSGFNRNAFKDPDFIYIHFIPVSNSWMWQIPITDEITSVGLVSQKQNFPNTKEGREKFFWECAELRPELLAELKKAKQIRDFTVEADYSYAMTELVKDNLVLIGDAARFVDPIFSSGVSIALNSARFASVDIIKALQNNNYEKSSFANYESTLKRGVNNWYRFIQMYYRLNILFTYFVDTPEYRLDVLKFLQGDVYDEENPPLLKAMEKIISQVEGNPKHPLHAMLGTLTSKSFNVFGAK